MTLAVRAGMDFIAALDQGNLGRVRKTVATGATWWVDTGPDRRGGDAGASPHGTGRFPLHGTMDMEKKLSLMGELGPSSFPTGYRQIPRRVIAGEFDCVIEVEGHGIHASGDVYENRHGFLFDVNEDGKITSVREYLDTIHAHQILGEGTQAPPRVALKYGDSRPPLNPATPLPPEGAKALALWPALAEGDIDAFEAEFHSGATFWTDSGLNRARGRFTENGDARINGPFHGRVPIAEKAALMRERLNAAGYTSPGVTVTPHRIICDGNLIGIEASGQASFGDSRYQNRYLWVVEADADGIHQAREYCDTLHIAELMGFPHEYGA